MDGAAKTKVGTLLYNEGTHSTTKERRDEIR